jgi:hypothetical protein
MDPSNKCVAKLKDCQKNTVQVFICTFCTINKKLNMNVHTFQISLVLGTVCI